MNELVFPAYGRCTANLACSVGKAFGLSMEHEAVPEAVALLRGFSGNVVIFLVDGLGEAVLADNLDSRGFFASHRLGSLSSVFPATTVASTTAVQSGLYPKETGWLGWTVYLPKEGVNVSAFLNQYAYRQEVAAPYDLMRRYCAYDSLVERVLSSGSGAALAATYASPFPGDAAGVCALTEQALARPGRRFVYAYVDEPDSTMHAKGVHAEESVAVLRKVEASIEGMCRRLKNTLVFIVGDHGHVDVSGVWLGDYPEILDCLVRERGEKGQWMMLRDGQGVPVRDPSLEPRAVNFFVEEGKRDAFRERFLNAFGEDFRLFSREEVLSLNLFGPGKAHPEFAGMLGDFVAAGFGRRAIFVTKKDRDKFKGHHTGMTREEMEVPLIACFTDGA